MKQALILMAFVLTGLNNYAQTEKPATLSADFVPGTVLTPTNEKLEGFIKESLKKDGTILFVNAQGQKKIYNTANLQSFSINGVVFIAYLYDFYKTVSSGTKAALYLKVTDNNGKLINSGSESIVATTTDGKIGDYFIQSKKDNDLTLVTKKNFEASILQVCSDCSALMADVKSKLLDYTQLVKVVEKYNSCTN